MDPLLDHLAWLRVPENEIALWDRSGHQDPAAGPNTAHFELIFAVSFGLFRRTEINADNCCRMELSLEHFLSRPLVTFYR